MNEKRGRGAPLGNNNPEKGKIYKGAIKRALARAFGSVENGLDAVADKLVQAAVAGDPIARKEIGDRMDGKPMQQIEAAIEHSGAIENIGLSATVSLIEEVAAGGMDRAPTKSLPH